MVKRAPTGLTDQTTSANALAHLGNYIMARNQRFKLAYGHLSKLCEAYALNIYKWIAYGCTLWEGIETYSKRHNVREIAT